VDREAILLCAACGRVVYEAPFSLPRFAGAAPEESWTWRQPHARMLIGSAAAEAGHDIPFA